MYAPQYRCHSCGVALRYNGQCDRCLAPHNRVDHEGDPTEEDAKAFMEGRACFGMCASCGHLAFLVGEHGTFLGTYCSKCQYRMQQNIEGRKDPTRHCCSCGIGTCDPGKSRCQKCETPEPKTITLRCKPFAWSITGNAMYGSQQVSLTSDRHRTVTLEFPLGHDLSHLGRRGAEFDVTITPVGQEQPKPEPMSVHRSIEILNKNDHSYHNDWWHENRGDRPVATRREGILFDLFGLMHMMTEFEAIAIAEKYEREGK